MKRKRRLISSGFIAAILLAVTIEGIFLEGCSKEDNQVLTEANPSYSATDISDNRDKADAAADETTYTESSDTVADTTADSTTTVPQTETDVQSTTDNTTQSTTTSGNTDGTASESTTSSTESTTEDITQMQTPTSSENDVAGNISFSVSSFKVDGNRTDDYYYEYMMNKGYKPVSNTGELASLCQNTFNTLTASQGVVYITTPYGLFDDADEKMKALKSQADSTGLYSDIYARDVYMYNYLGLDYQLFYSKGISLFLFQWVQDINSTYSVYAVCYYAYETQAQMAEVDSVINNVISGFEGLDDYNKILAAHDYICRTTEYKGGTYAHTAYGALINGSAVCEGYAKAYKRMLNAMGFECDIVINSSHAWVTVKYNNSWYFIDITNDDTNSSYVFFMLGQDVLKHTGTVVVDNSLFDFSFYGYTTGNNTDTKTLSATSLYRRIEYRSVG